MDDLMRNLGQYVGEGTWRDDAGESRRYRIEMTLEPAEGGLRQAFRHIFFEGDEPDVLQSMEFKVHAPSILSFTMGDLTGRGFYTADVLHYTIPVPGNAVQATHFFDRRGVRVVGSAEKNKAGRFVMWEELLERA